MPISVAFIRELETIDPKIRRVLLLLLEELEKQREESVSKKEFNELKEIIRGIGKAIRELAQAQKKTEERLEELAQAQKKTEERLEELAQAQKKTEERLEELAQAQKKTEERLEELAQAQKKTEEEIAKLTKRMDVFETRLEGISDTIGYTLENTSYQALPKILAERYKLSVQGRLIRRYILIDSKEFQINIYGHAKREEKELLILGECKVRPSKREIERFLKRAKQIAQIEGKEAFLLFVAHDFHPNVEKLLQEKGIAYFWSYELQS